MGDRKEKLLDSENDVQLAMEIHRTAHANAARYLEDAKVLAEHGSVGHAAGLAILGQEEAGKSLYFAILGHGGFPDNSSLRREMFWRHEIKQVFFIVADFASRVLADPRTEAAIEGVDFGSLSDLSQFTGELGRLWPEIAPVLEDAFGDGGHIAEDVQGVQDLKRQQRVKHQAFYVDEKGGAVQDPLEFDRDEMLAEVSKLQRVIDTLVVFRESPSLTLELRTALLPLFELARRAGKAQGGRGRRRE